MKHVYYGLMVLVCCCTSMYAMHTIIVEPKSTLGVRQRTEILPTPIIPDLQCCSTCCFYLIDKPGVYGLTQDTYGYIIVQSDNVTLLFGGYTLHGALIVDGNYFDGDLQQGWIIANEGRHAVTVGNAQKPLNQFSIKNGGLSSTGPHGSIFFKRLAEGDTYQGVTIDNMKFVADQLCSAVVTINQGFDVRINGCSVQVVPSEVLPGDAFFKGIVVANSFNVNIVNATLIGPKSHPKLLDINDGMFGFVLKYCSTANIKNCLIQNISCKSCLCGMLFKDSEKVAVQQNNVQNLELQVATDMTLLGTSPKLFAAGMQFLRSQDISVGNNQIHNLAMTIQKNIQNAVYHCVALETLDSVGCGITGNDIQNILISGLENGYNPQSNIFGINVATRYNETLNTYTVIHDNNINSVGNESLDNLDASKNGCFGIALLSEYLNQCAVIGNRLFNIYCKNALNMPHGKAYAYIANRLIDSTNFFANNLAYGTLAGTAEDYSPATFASAVCKAEAALMANVKTLNC